VDEGERPPEPPSAPPARPRRRRFGPGGATVVFLAFLGAQFLAGILMAVAAAVLNAFGPQRPLMDVLADLMPALFIESLALSGAAALLVTRLLVGQPLRGVVARRFGLQLSTWRATLAGAGAGVLLGAVLVGALVLVPPRDIDTPMSRVAATPTGYWSLVFLALVLAPPIEEFVFRGVIYRGLRTRMPAAAAAILVTVVFTGLHAGELVHYWPGFGLIALLSLVTIALRVRTGSLLPAVAAHFGYNACAMALAHPW
jgi:membrane protease YdiL (CAAX protease family)